MAMEYPFVHYSYYQRLFREIISFFRNPNYKPIGGLSAKAKAYDTIGLYIIKIALLILVAVFWALLSSVYDPENLSKSTMSERFSPVILLLVGGFILPLVEEINFRLSLRFKPIYLSLTIITPDLLLADKSYLSNINEPGR